MLLRNLFVVLGVAAVALAQPAGRGGMPQGPPPTYTNLEYAAAGSA